MAKTQYSFSTDPNLRGAPTGHVVPVREVRLPPAPASSSPSAARS
jgi:formyltetrahydrofolate synthetase